MNARKCGDIRRSLKIAKWIFHSTPFKEGDDDILAQK